MDRAGPLTKAMGLAAQRSLSAVHGTGYVHGDVDLRNLVAVAGIGGSEPGSLLVKVIDFGQARRAEGAAVQEEQRELVHVFALEVRTLNPKP